MRLAFSSDGKSFGEPKIIPTPSSYEETVKVFGDAVKEIVGSGTIVSAAGGITRALARQDNSGHIFHWSDDKEKLEKDFGEVIGAPVYFENDAAVCGLGEAVYGAGKGYDIVMYMTVSTGVGGARIVNQKIDPSALGFEPGHQIVDMPRTFRTELNPKGRLEGYVSGKALELRFLKKPKEVTDPAVWEELAGELAYGVHNSIVHWSPDVVVLGGSMITGDPAISVDKVESYLKDILEIFPKIPPIKKATLKDVGGLWGALELAKQKTSSVFKEDEIEEEKKGFLSKLLGI